MNVDKIEIMDNNIFLSIYPKTSEIEIEGKKYKIDQELINELFKIIRTWDNEYIDNSYQDGIRYEIKIYEKDNIEVLKGTRKTPDNYNNFSKIIRGIYERR